MVSRGWLPPQSSWITHSSGQNGHWMPVMDALSLHLSSTCSIQFTLLFLSFDNPVFNLLFREHHVWLSSFYNLPVASEWPIVPRGQYTLESSDYTHTHTLTDTVSPCLLPTGAAHLVAANAEDAANSLWTSCTSSWTNILCSNFNSPNPQEPTLLFLSSNNPQEP